MNKNRVMWIVVFIVVTITIATSIRTSRSQNQEIQLQQKQDGISQDKRDFRMKDRKEYEAQFPIADYDEPETSNLEERQKRKEKSKRYDNHSLVVVKNPGSGYVEGQLVDEKPPTPAIPTAESKAVIIGEVLDAKAHLSSNKQGIYSEFTVRVDEILKNNDSQKIVQGSSIIADREGGSVRYSDGQKILYTVSGKGMPRIGKRVVLFLTQSDQSSNYYILAGYEFKEGKVYSIDGGLQFRKFEGLNETDFMTTLRRALAPPPRKTEN